MSQKVSGVSKVLRRLPVLRRYYRMIATLEAQFSATLASQEAQFSATLASHEVKFQAYRHAAQNEVAQVREALAATESLAHAFEVERGLAQNAAETLTGELIVARANSAQCEKELGEVRARLSAQETLQHALETERERLEKAAEDRFVSLANVILTRLAGYSFEASAGASKIDAHILGLTTRLQEAVLSQRRASTTALGVGEPLYLDLLESALCGVLSVDAGMGMAENSKYDPNVRSIGRDWPANAQTMIGTARMRNLRMLLLEALDLGIPGDFCETGVWRGGACIYAKGIFAVRNEFDRRVFVADSFRGLPPPDPAKYAADDGDLHSTFQELAVSRAEVEDNFRRFGLLDDTVVFLEGWFKDTLPSAPIDKLAVLRLDGDMYESTMDALVALYRKVSPNGFIIIDDFGLPACAAAVEDFRNANDIKAPMHEVDGAAVWWQVPA